MIPLDVEILCGSSGISLLKDFLNREEETKLACCFKRAIFGHEKRHMRSSFFPIWKDKAQHGSKATLYFCSLVRLLNFTLVINPKL